ncbi:hypothetical protein ACO0SA_000647 [Hanseniaspora valbyensis]
MVSTVDEENSLVNVSLTDEEVGSHNAINESFYGDNDSLLPPSTTVDEDYDKNYNNEQDMQHTGSEYENSSLKIIYSNENNAINEPIQNIPISFTDNNENNAINISSEQLLYEEYKIACQQGDLAKVKEFIDTKIIDYHNDTDPSLNDNITGLHWAAINNRLSVIKYLAALPGYNINAISTDASKTTALHWAAKYGYTYIIKELIANGADYHLSDSQNLNLLHLTTLSSNILTVIYVLLNFPDIDINAQDNDGRTAMMWSCYQGDNLTVATFLKLADNDNELSLNVKDKTGFNCLHWAIVKGNVDVLSMVIKKIDSSIKSYLFEEVEMNGAKKNCFIIAKEMNTEYALKTALSKNGYDYKGNTLVSESLVGRFFEINYISNSMKNNLFPCFFIVPFIQLGIFNKLGDFLNPLLLMLVVQPLLLVAFGFLYLKIMLPLFIKNPGVTFKAQVNKLLNSTPLLSGILWSTIVWAMYLHITRIMYYGFSELDFFYYIRSSLVIYWLLPYLLYKLMFVIEPGYVELDQSREVIKQNIDNLMAKSQYNLRHFCVDTLHPVILRSRYLYRNDKLINKFDHFCIWIFNDVGLNNHKFFIYFLIVLIYGVSLIVEGSHGYFEYLEDHYKYRKCFLIGHDELCAAFRKDSFMLYNVIWMCMQAVWVSLLLLIQLFTISKGFTSNEFEALKNKFTKNHKHKCNSSSSSSKDACQDEGEEENNIFSNSQDGEQNTSLLKQSFEDEIDNLDDNNYSITVKEFKDFETAPRDSYKRSFVYANDKNYQAEKLIDKRQRMFFHNVTTQKNEHIIKVNKFIKKHKFLSNMVKSSGIINFFQLLFTIYYSYNGSITTISLYDFGVIQNFKDFFLNTDLKAPTWRRLINENLNINEALMNGQVVDFDHLYEYLDEFSDDDRFNFDTDDERAFEEERV